MKPRLEWFARRPGATALVATLLVVAVFLAAYAFLREKSSLVVIEATAEYVAYTVARPEVASIPLARVRQTLGRPCHSTTERQAASGLLLPSRGVAVHYRWFPERVTVLLDGPAAESVQLQYYDDQGEQRACNLPDRRNAFALDVDPMDPKARAAAWPLPIAGPAQVGAEIGSPAARKPGAPRDYTVLVAGQLQVYGRASRLQSPRALIPPLDEPLAIPAGSRLTSSGDPTAPGRPAGAPWYGYAFVADNGFRVSATTETAELFIYRPSGREPQREVVRVGLFTELLTDPSLAFIAFGFLVLVAAGQLVCGWVGVWRSGGDDDD